MVIKVDQSVILASQSAYRAELLGKIISNFKQQAADIDESPKAGESPTELSLRLAEEKARHIAQQSSKPALVIGSDQVACLNQQILGKPLSTAKAAQQLQACSGQSVHFYTSLCLLNTATNNCQLSVETYEVKFRELNEQEIARYIEIEQPLDCAGSFKMEGLGISLFEHIRGDDPNSLIGLPLIRLCELLRHEGLVIP